MKHGVSLLAQGAYVLATQPQAMQSAAALSMSVLRSPNLLSSTSPLLRFKTTSAAPHAAVEAATAAAGGPSKASDKKEDQSSIPDIKPHKGLQQRNPDENVFPGPVYDSDYLQRIKPVHVPIATLHQRVGFVVVTIMRTAFDFFTGYDKTPGKMTELKWLRRVIFLETVAGVPGMVAGMLRHMRSLRSLQKDNGWIHTLLEEAENERMHLLTFLNLRQPGPLFRLMVLLTQGVFFNVYLLCYIIYPKACHSFVGYLEEEAVKTYTHMLEEIDAGRLWKGKAAPKTAIDYWKLPADATMRELILAIRADEACHSHVNHTFAHKKPDEPSPFSDPKTSHLVP